MGLVERKREQVSELVPAGETVLHAISVNSGSFAPVGLATIGLEGAAGLGGTQFRTIAVTDQALYVLTQKVSGAPKAVEARFPLGSVAVRTEKAAGLHRTLFIGDQKVRIPMQYKKEGEMLAAAAAAAAAGA